jgi:hypothetical protein
MKYLRPSLAIALSTFLVPLVYSQSGPETFSGSNTTQIVSVQQHSSGYALTASTPSTHSVGAVLGKATASSGTAKGGMFYSFSSAGTGVLGSACNQNSTANCTGIGVHGIVNGLNTSATAGLFEISGSDGGGNILIGRFDGANVFRVGESGDVYADGGVHTNGADFAESFAVKGSASAYQPGDVLVIDGNSDRQVTLSQEPYSTMVAGIYSTKPGIVGSPHSINEADSVPAIPMAMIGVVPTKVSAENGPIQRGDLLVTSSHAGYAMKGTDASKMQGAVLGKALQPLSGGEGVIEVLVTLR